MRQGAARRPGQGMEGIMKILLTAINAKYIHSNLAVYSLRAYAEEYREHIGIAEYTINQRGGHILREVYRQRPDVLCVSCYIWNIRQVEELITEIHKLRPELPIWLGGPEVSYETEAFLERCPMASGVMVGEGEATFRDLCAHYVALGEAGADLAKGVEGLARIPGLVFRASDGKLVRTPGREPLPMDSLPFCYGGLEAFQNRILYYESSRGCPFSCSYCLSSLEKGMRFRSLPLVEQELQFFLDHGVPQVKFVDRTFNCSHGHAMAVWQYLKEHDNGITNFHFEIAADLLTEEEISLLASLRPGQAQLEIGVQTTHMPTVKEIRRAMDLGRLERAVLRLQEAGNIHLHLDLIAGLPLEGFETFARSFADVYRLKPQQLQLGFLKSLKGSYIDSRREAYGMICQEGPPYEVMATAWLSYDEMLEIKLAEEMLETYYNSGQFEITAKVMELAWENPFFLYLELGRFYERRGLLDVSHSRIRRCEILLEFLEEKDPEHGELYSETLTYDLYARENMKTRPAFACDASSFREETRRYCRNGKLSHVEPFFYDMEAARRARTLYSYPQKNEERQFYLFSYPQEGNKGAAGRRGVSVRKIETGQDAKGNG